MPDSSTGQGRIFRFTAREGDWRELLRQLNEFATMVQTNLQTDRITTKGVVFVPVDPTNWRKDETPLGLMFLNKARWDDFSGNYPWWVVPDSANKKHFEYLTMWATAYFTEE